MDMGKEAVKTRRSRLLLDVFQFVGVSRHNKIPNSGGLFKLIVRSH
jgi:hypothetical protein